MESTRIAPCSKYRLRAPALHMSLCGLDGDRTHDLLFRRQTLYPLSYKPVRQTTLHCLEMKATLFTEKRSSNLGSLLRKHSYGGSFDSTPNPRGEITGIERSRFKCWCRRRRRHRLVLIICSCRGLERGADDLVGALPRLVADLDVFARAWFQGGCHVVRAHEPVPGPGLVHVDEHGADQSDQGLA